MLGNGCFVMKKIYWSFAVCCMIMGIMMTDAVVCADTGDGYEYELLDDDTVEITGYNGTESEVVIPDKLGGNTVSSIGDWAFSESGITEVTIPECVTNIGRGAFCGCTNLTTVTILGDLDSIGASAFEECDSLMEIDMQGSVGAIGEATFEECSSLTEVVIPKGITTIEYSTFYACSDLESVEIPSSVTCIGNSAFEGCSSLEELIIPTSVTEIGDSAFSGCIGLVELTIPASVESIGSQVFTECFGLMTITVDGDNTVYDSRENCNAIIETSTDRLIAGCQNTVIPETVKIIGEWVFAYYEDLEQIVIPEGVTSIENSAFFYCGFTELTIPKSVTSIGEDAFSRCDLTTVTVAAGNKVYDSRDNCNAIIETDANRLIAGYKTTVIPDTVTCIGTLAFFACNDLKQMVIPASVTSIERLAFSDCGSLVEVNIPASVTSIGEGAFADCNENLTIITEEGSVAEEYAEKNNIKYSATHTHISNQDDGDCTTAITCAGCGEIMTAAYPSHTGGTATCMEGAHCVRCGKIYGSANPSNHVGGTVVKNKKDATTQEEGYTGDTCCVSCGRMITAGTAIPIVPVNVVGATTATGNEVEEAVVVLETAQNPKIGEKFALDGLFYKITSIDKRTVSCMGLAQKVTEESYLVIPQGIKIDNVIYTVSKIEASAFANENLLRYVTLGNGVSEIGDGAFENGTYLRMVTFGKGLTSIGERAFQNCTVLNSIEITSTKLKCVGKAAFKNTKNYSITAPKGMQSTYKTLLKNSDKAKSVVASNIFYQVTNEKQKTVKCVGLAKQTSKVTIPSTVTVSGIKYKVTEIGNNAFKNDKKVTKVALQSTNLTTIGSYAFQNCKKLKQLTIKSTKLKKVGKKAFKGCKMDVTVPDQVMNKYSKLFKGKW